MQLEPSTPHRLKGQRKKKEVDQHLWHAEAEHDAGEAEEVAESCLGVDRNLYPLVEGLGSLRLRGTSQDCHSNQQLQTLRPGHSIS